MLKHTLDLKKYETQCSNEFYLYANSFRLWELSTEWFIRSFFIANCIKQIDKHTDIAFLAGMRIQDDDIYACYQLGMLPGYAVNKSVCLKIKGLGVLIHIIGHDGILPVDIQRKDLWYMYKMLAKHCFLKGFFTTI